MVHDRVMVERANPVPRGGPKGGRATYDAYRASTLRADAIGASIPLGLTIAALVAMIPNDRIAVANARDLHQLLGVRIVCAAICLIAIAIMLRTRRPAVFDRTVTVAVLAIACSIAFIASTRPPEYMGHATVNAVLVSILYFATPGPLVSRFVATAIVSIGTFAFSYRADSQVMGRNALIVSHVVTHIIGAIFAWRMEALRFRQFEALTEAHEAKVMLEDQAKKLRAETERALALARAKSDFLATMSHEFRTPMNAIMGMSDLLADAPIGDTAKAQARTIHQSATSLLSLLNDILDHAKIDAGYLTVSAHATDLPLLLRDTVDMFAHEASEKGIELRLEIDPGMPPGLLVDAARLRQVLVNLTGNAVKFTSQGSVTLSARALRQGGGPAALSFSVSDTGPGIAPEDRERMFLPFEQADQAIGRKHGGTGLGLSISRQLVTLLGGELGLESHVGKGTTFSFTLALEPCELPVRHAPSTKEPVAQTPPLSVLVADDNNVNRLVIRGLLEKLGYTPTIVSGGQEAIDMTAQHHFDVILMDVQMPDIDGLRATRAILERASPKARPRVVALTASAFDDDRARCAAAGMVGFLSKPLAIADLARELDRVCALEGSGAPAGAEL